MAEVHELIGLLDALAATEAVFASGSQAEGREGLARSLIAAMRANAEALSRLANETGDDGPAGGDARSGAVVEGGVDGLVRGLDRNLPRLEDELRRLGPSVHELAVRLGAGLVEGVASQLEARGPQLAESTARLAAGLAAGLAEQLRALGRGVRARALARVPGWPAFAAAGAGTLLAVGLVAATRRTR